MKKEFKLSEHSRQVLGEEARRGHHERAKQLKWSNPHPPLGYDVGEDGRLEINDDEAEIIKTIFDLYLSYISIRKVADVLNSFRIHTKKGKYWDGRGISYILHNEIYIGWFNSAGVRAYVPEIQIIDKKMFDETERTLGLSTGKKLELQKYKVKRAKKNS